MVLLYACKWCICVYVFREACSRHEQRVVDLEAKLRGVEMTGEWSGAVKGLCVSCAQNEATDAAACQQSVDSLTRYITLYTAVSVYDTFYTTVSVSLYCM